MIPINNPLFLSKAFNIIKAFDTPQDEFLTTQLSKKSNISWGHSQKAIKQLCDKGYLTKDKLKGRRRIIRLTEKGKRIWYMTREMSQLI
jgi:predicted transcriptional regulator